MTLPSPRLSRTPMLHGDRYASHAGLAADLARQAADRH